MINFELNGFITAAKSIADDARAKFGALSETQLNWQPDEKSWSVGLCFEHLIRTNEEMTAAIEKRFESGQRKTFFEKLPFLSKFVGKQILKAVQPENKSKMKAPKVFRPVNRQVAADVIERFAAEQQKVIGLMTSGAELDLEKTIVTSPIAPMVVYSLWDAYKIIVTHERRHFRQAAEVMKNAEFPR